MHSHRLIRLTNVLNTEVDEQSKELKEGKRENQREKEEEVGGS